MENVSSENEDAKQLTQFFSDAEDRDNNFKTELSENEVSTNSASNIAEKNVKSPPRQSSEAEDHDNYSKVGLNESELSANSASHVSSPPRPSTGSECAICLGTTVNRSFSDGCFHSFCFTCLLEWSKVKAKCPMCKMPFKSIMHNVRSMEDYDQYDIPPIKPDTSRRRARSSACYWTLQDFIKHKTQHSVGNESIPEHSHTSSFRRLIYRRGLWVKPLGDGKTQKYRDTSPEFFLQNPACTHRLTPWLHRELLILLHNNKSQAEAVLDLILQLVTWCDIRSEEFRARVASHLHHRTNHFIHEFFNYASSVHDMHDYDKRGVYEKLNPTSRNNINVVSSSGGSVVPITEPPVTISGSPVPLRQTEDTGSSNPCIDGSERSELLYGTGEDSNVRHSALPAPHSLSSVPDEGPSYNAKSSSLREFLGAVSGPSTSGLQRPAVHFETATGKDYHRGTKPSGSPADSDDDCVVRVIINLRTGSVHNYPLMAQAKKGKRCSSKRRVPEEEEAVYMKESRKKLRPYKEMCSSSSSTLEKSSNCGKERCFEKSLHNNLSSDLVWLTTSEVSHTKPRLQSVVCRVPFNDRQNNNHRDSNHQSTSHSNKHKKETKHGGHRSQEHSHSVSELSRHSSGPSKKHKHEKKKALGKHKYEKHSHPVRD